MNTMMMRLNDWKVRFPKEKKVRMKVYLVAAVVTLVMQFAAWCMLGGSFLGAVVTVASVGATLALYYVSGGFCAFLVVMRCISKAAYWICSVLAFLTAWMVGMGLVVQILLPPMIVMCCCMTGVMMALMMPGVFVPMLYVVSKLLEKLGDEDEAVVAEMPAAE